MSWFFDDDHRALQDRFGTRALADRLEETDLRTVIGDSERAFIESRDMVFVATVDHEGRPTVSYKGGEPGFIVVADETTLLLPSYDGNGMYLTMGNAAARAEIGLLFIDFQKPRRLRLQGRATIDTSPATLSHWPGAELALRIAVSRLWVNCPRYVHRYEKVAPSRYVPDGDGAAPPAGWKRIGSVQDVLRPDEVAAAERQGLITDDAWNAMVEAGDEEA